MPLRSTRSTAARSSSPMSGLAGGMKSLLSLCLQGEAVGGLPVALAGLGARPQCRCGLLEPAAGAADPADLSRGHAGHEGVVGTSLVTTAPAATIAHRPMRTGATQTARAPIEAPSSMVTPTGSQSAADLRVPSG